MCLFFFLPQLGLFYGWQAELTGKRAYGWGTCVLLRRLFCDRNRLGCTLSIAYFGLFGVQRKAGGGLERAEQELID
jgi:hypothetical protein